MEDKNTNICISKELYNIFLINLNGNKEFLDDMLKQIQIVNNCNQEDIKENEILNKILRIATNRYFLPFHNLNFGLYPVLLNRYITNLDLLFL